MKLIKLLLLTLMVSAFGADAGMSAPAPGDVTVKRDTSKGEAYNPATFPHWIHVIRYRCYACHPAPFKMVNFKLRRGTLKQDRGPYEAPAAASGKETAPDEVKGKEKEKTEANSTPGEQPPPAAVPVVPVEQAGKEAEKKPSEKKEASAGKEAGKTEAERGAMHGEKGCGMCHNGNIAFKVEFKVCGKCHLK